MINKLSIYILLLFACSNPTGNGDVDTLGDTPREDLVAVSAKFSDGLGKLVLFDINDPSRYKVVTKISSVYKTNEISLDLIMPRFSPDKSIILFQDNNNFSFDPSTELYLSYFLDKDSVDFMHDSHNDVRGRMAVWSNDGTGFYYNHGSSDVIFFNIIEKRFSDFAGFLISGHSLLQVVETTFDNRLLVFGGALSEFNQPLGLYFMTEQAKYHSNAGQPIFGDNIVTDYSIATKRAANGERRAAHLRWYEDKKLFVYADAPPGFFSTGNIFVSDMEGLVDIAVPESDNGARPAWGPGGNSVLFEQDGSIMIYDMVLETTKLLVSPESIGAVSLHTPDY